MSGSGKSSCGFFCSFWLVWRAVLDCNERLENSTSGFDGDMAFQRDQFIADVKKIFGSLVRWAVRLYAVFLVISWIFLIEKAPGNTPRLIKAREAIVEACDYAFQGADVRIETKAGNDVSVYITKNDFENVPYPDHDAVVGRVGHAWCKNWNMILLPAVSIRDIRTGDELAHYSCIRERMRTKLTWAKAP